MAEEKNHIIKSVSLTLDEVDFIKEYQLSPTQLLKEKIWDMKGIFKNIAMRKIEKLERINQEYLKQIDLLEREIKLHQAPVIEEQHDLR